MAILSLLSPRGLSNMMILLRGLSLVFSEILHGARVYALNWKYRFHKTNSEQTVEKRQRHNFSCCLFIYVTHLE